MPDKHKLDFPMQNKGFAIIELIVVIVLIAVAAGGIFIWQKQKTSSIQPDATTTPTSDQSSFGSLGPTKSSMPTITTPDDSSRRIPGKEYKRVTEWVNLLAVDGELPKYYKEAHNMALEEATDIQLKEIEIFIGDLLGLGIEREYSKKYVYWFWSGKLKTGYKYFRDDEAGTLEAGLKHEDTFTYDSNVESVKISLREAARLIENKAPNPIYSSIHITFKKGWEDQPAYWYFQLFKDDTGPTPSSVEEIEKALERVREPWKVNSNTGEVSKW